MTTTVAVSTPDTTPDGQTISLLSGVVVLRVALLVWAAIVVTIDAQGVAPIRVGLAGVVLCVLAAWTAAFAWLVRRRPSFVVRWCVGLVDIGLAALVAGADQLVYTGAHPQTFASAWPLCAAVVAGVVHGWRAGAVAGLVIGVAGAVGVAWFRTDGMEGRWMGAIGTIVLMTVSGVLAGVVTDLLRRAEMTAAHAAAREDVARRLHDGVLQTLAVVQRRSDDPELVGLAREQELDLRRFIEADEPDTSDDLVAELRNALGTAERRTGLRCELVVIDPPTRRDPAVVSGLCGAVSEAITNASKHGAAERVVVCVDAEGGAVVCTVNDDGRGFDTSSTREGTGLTRSVRGRIEDLGGSVELVSTPGRGCDITMRVP